MENNMNEDVNPEVKPEDVNAEQTTEEVNNNEEGVTTAEEKKVETDITGQPIVDESSYVKTPEQIKAERKEKWKKLVFGDKTKEKKEPMDKQDVLCYLGAFLCFFLALLPFLLKTFNPNHDPDSFFNKQEEEPPVKIAYKKLNCNRTSEQTGYSYDIATVGTYANNVIEKLEITYTLTKEEQELSYDSIEIQEFVELSNINSEAITENVSDVENKRIYKVIIDFKNESINELKKELPISAHAAILPSQRENYTNEGFSCIIENVGEQNASN